MERGSLWSNRSGAMISEFTLKIGQILKLNLKLTMTTMSGVNGDCNGNRHCRLTRRSGWPLTHSGGCWRCYAMSTLVHLIPKSGLFFTHHGGCWRSSSIVRLAPFPISGEGGAGRRLSEYRSWCAQSSHT